MAPPTVKIKHLTRSPGNTTRFPKLDECAHFHYENVELGPITVQLCENQSDPSKQLHLVTHSANKENETDSLCFLVMVSSNDRKWVVRRTYKNFVFLDKQLHRCVYDRKYSLLQELPSAAPTNVEDEDSDEKIRNLLSEYLERFSQLAGSLINCGPVLNWLELDNRGNRLIVTDEVAINTPAVAAAYVVMCHSAQAADEISFDVGDMISVIDMPPPDESTWWRGKKGYEVGFFPSECVEVIGDKVPHAFKLSSTTSTKPVFRKHGKLIAFFRSFLLSRPSRRRLKQSGILKERVFGCDLGEHLLNTGREIPLVLKCCTEFIEEFGVVDGIYRLSGVNSNIQRLRLAFDEDRATNLGDPSVAQDVHSVASLLKMYFRELPNPLLTYQLYDKFVSAVQSDEDVRLLRIRDVVQQLPPPHYRTLQFLLDHLARIASHGSQTGMTPKNIAIVWAPNLLRSREVENGGVGALHVVGVQAVLTEYLIRYADLIFDEKMSVCLSGSPDESISLRVRPKSLAISTPTKLLSLEEARARALSTHLPLTQQKYIEVGGGPDKLPSKYHTVIDLPPGKHGCTKLKKSPSGWKSFFSRGWYSGSARDKNRPSRNSRKASTASLPHTSMHVQEKNGSDQDMAYGYPMKLRTVKSAESLVHCLKESLPVTTEDDRSISSPKSPQLVSMESSYCFDTPCSAYPRSPSLQRHTRSSSHESYFENSIDMASDPSIEDEGSLYYFVKEQMQKLQKEADLASWITADESECKKPVEIMDNYSKYPDSNVVVPNLFQMSDNDFDKVARKQKFSATDGDYALAKVQRLSWIDNESSNKPRDIIDCAALSPLDFSSTTESAKSPNLFKFSDEIDTGSYASSSLFREDFPWLQEMALQSTDYSEPSIFPSSLSDSRDKHLSVISTSDTEAEISSKTIVERYGNAETVLVEVHATQESSSESEGDINNFQNLMEEHFERDNEVTNLCSYHEEAVNISKLKEDVKDEFMDESFKTGLMDVPCSTMIMSESVSNSSVGTGNNYECELTLESGNEDEPIAEKNDKCLDLGISEDALCPNYGNTPIVCSDLSSDDEPCSPIDDVIISNEEIFKSSDIAIDDSVAISDDLNTTPESLNSFVIHPQHSSIYSRDKSEQAGLVQSEEEEEEEEEEDGVSTQKDEYVTDNKMVSDSTKSNVLETNEIESPSVSPPKQSSALEVHSFRTKIEHIPLHRKRQILNIPTPSSPVEEVRKKFETRASSEKRNTPVESPACHRSLPNATELPTKLNRRHTELFEPQNPVVDTLEAVKRKSDAILSAKMEIMPNKRHSEPCTAPPKCNTAKITSSPPSSIDKVSESKSLCESSNVKNKPLLPSLFTQLKVRKLQSLQGESPTRVVDPWSDPILDMQDDYHPVVCYPEITRISDVSHVQPESDDVSGRDDSTSCTRLTFSGDHSNTGVCEESSRIMDSKSAAQEVNLKDQEIEYLYTKSKGIEDVDSSKTTCSESVETSKVPCEIETKLSPKDVVEDEAVRRERINRIKEERRAQLREKLKSESFRLEAEEKEKIQTKFRFRKDHGRHTVTACLSDSSECISGELTEMDRNRMSADKTDEVQKASTHLEGSASTEYSDVPSGIPTCDTKSKSSTGCQSNTGDSISISKKIVKSDAFNVSGSADLNTKKVAGISVSQPLSSRESKFHSLTDVRDRVAMFERSKDKDLCRSGPNGKFTQKQSASTLTPSFVR